LKKLFNYCAEAVASLKDLHRTPEGLNVSTASLAPFYAAIISGSVLFICVVGSLCSFYILKSQQQILAEQKISASAEQQTPVKTSPAGMNFLPRLSALEASVQSAGSTVVALKNGEPSPRVPNGNDLAPEEAAAVLVELKSATTNQPIIDKTIQSHPKIESKPNQVNTQSTSAVLSAAPVNPVNSEISKDPRDAQKTLVAKSQNINPIATTVVAPTQTAQPNQVLRSPNQVSIEQPKTPIKPRYPSQDETARTTQNIASQESHLVQSTSSPAQPHQSAPPSSANQAGTVTVSADMIAAAKRTTKIEGVEFSKIGISKINDNSISLKNGTVIRIGDQFPSGERLLSVDPENSQILTDKRTILAF
jgi:hypothetical protein